jgi:hypothetical protein
MASGEDAPIPFSFTAQILYWRGPSPFFFAPIPLDQAPALRRAAKSVTYGWGVVPVEASIAGVAFTTSLFPKDETYLLPIKAAVRRKANITAGDVIAVEMVVGAGRR